MKTPRLFFWLIVMVLSVGCRLLQDASPGRTASAAGSASYTPVTVRQSTRYHPLRTYLEAADGTWWRAPGRWGPEGDTFEIALPMACRWYGWEPICYAAQWREESR